MAPLIPPSLAEFCRLPLDVFMSELQVWPRDDRDDALRARMMLDSLLFYTVAFPSLVLLGYNPANRWLARQFAAVPSYQERWDSRAELRRLAVEVNRGARKTTILKMEVARRMTYGMEPFVLWGGSDEPNARKECAHVRYLMQHPSDAFVHLFGQPRVTGGDTSWELTTEIGGTTAMERRGMPGQQTRGANVHGQRPSMICLDDIETPKSVENLKLRDELTAYEDSDVANAPPDYGGWMVCAGTRLHPDSQTARRAANPAYVSRTFKAVLRWPERAELWEQARALWADLADPLRERTAADFYFAHKVEMDQGARVLDPEARPIWACMVKLWSIGRRQFYRDYQNEPLADGNAIFDVEEIRLHSLCRFDPAHGGSIRRMTGRDQDGVPTYSDPIPLSSCRIAVWLDPRASDDVKRNDFAAIGIVARDPKGYRYGIRVELERDKPSGGRARMWRIFDWLGPRAVYGYEDNGSQTLHGESFDREREDRKRAGLPFDFRPVGYTSSENKLDRIGRLQPDMELHGWFQLADDLPGEFWEQLRDLRPGGGGHDDGPDALERADWLLTQQQDHSITYGRPPWMR